MSATVFDFTTRKPLSAKETDALRRQAGSREDAQNVSHEFSQLLAAAAQENFEIKDVIIVIPRGADAMVIGFNASGEPQRMENLLASACKKVTRVNRQPAEETPCDEPA